MIIEYTIFYKYISTKLTSFMSYLLHVFFMSSQDSLKRRDMYATQRFMLLHSSGISYIHIF